MGQGARVMSNRTDSGDQPLADVFLPIPGLCLETSNFPERGSFICRSLTAFRSVYLKA